MAYFQGNSHFSVQSGSLRAPALSLALFMKVHVLTLSIKLLNFPGKELFYKRSLIINIGLYQSMGWLIGAEILL